MSAAAGDEAAGRPMQVDGEDDHRAYIFEFFRSHNAYDLLPESGKVLLLDSSVSAYSAFCILSANEQDAAPVWDARTEKYMGMVTLTDMLELVNICQNSKVFTSCLEGMKEMTLDNWMTSYPRPPGCPDISVEAHPDDDLMVVLKTLVRNDCRVLPVMEREAAGEMLQNCLIGQVSYNLLFRFLYFHQVEDLTSLSDTLLDVGIGTFPAEKVKTCRLDDSVAHALSLLSENGISGLPVLNGMGQPVDIFVDKDLMSLTSLDFEVTVEKALEMARPGGHTRDVGSFTCSINDPLSVVVAKFSDSKSTRLACVDDDGMIEGVVTLTDLFKFLVTRA